MKPEVSTLFGELLSASLEERERYYAAHSISEDTRREVESLLAFDRGATIQDIVHHAVGVVFQEPVSDGDYCGPFRLLRVIGRGGMGVVYLAERADGEVRQRVAVKLLRSSLDSPTARQRFLQERQILAHLAHPNIARLIDAGHRSDGHPYLVMEYIDGQPIDQYCRQLPVRDKIALIATVCETIASAHHKLVVHRDLKPGNILVDSHGNPRVLDFGIAKLIDESDSTTTIERRLTPEYASPEQMIGAPATTATDIYSLGAVLYELLTGQAPSRDQLVPPSQKNAALDRDLDAIVLKTIRVEPEERYSTADKFAEDLRAWLDRRPVSARQGERWYHLRRQVRRHWVAATAGVVAASGLIAGLIIARAERDIAQQRFDDVRQLANEFFAVSKDIQGVPGSSTVRERMVRTSIKYLEGLSKRAGNDWRLKAEIATGYRNAAEAQGVFRGVNLGRPAEARQSLEKAAALMAEVSASAPNDRSVLHDRIELVELQARLEYGARDMKALESKIDELVGLVTAYEATAKDELPEWQFLGKTYESIAVSARELSRVDLAMKFARRGLDLQQKVVQTDRSLATRLRFANSLAAFALLRRATGDLSGAIETYQQSLAGLEQIAAENPNHYTTQLNIANVHLALGRNSGDVNGPSLRQTGEALRHFEESLRVGRRVMEMDPNDNQIRFNHSITAWRYGDALRARDPRKALAVYDEAIDILRPMQGKRFNRDMPLMANLAESTFALRAVGRDSETPARLKEANAICDSYRGSQSAAIYQTCRELISRAEAGFAIARGRPLDAVAIHGEWLQFVENDKATQEVKEDIFSAYQLASRYRLLRDAQIAAGMKDEARETEAKRQAVAALWRSRLTGKNDAELFLLR